MKRVVTALVGIPVVLLATLYSPDWLFAFLIAAFAALCFEELLALLRDAEGRPGRFWEASRGFSQRWYFL
jgi:CDP-diglyceride synthetase